MKILWIDTETTGLSTAKHGIVSISALYDIDNTEVSRFSATMKPTGRVADQIALDVNGFTREQISTFHDWSRVLIDFISWLKEIDCKPCYFGGFCNNFDLRFVENWFKSCSISSSFLEYIDDKNLIDVHKIIKSSNHPKLLDFPNHKLATVAQGMMIEIVDYHTSLGDILATREIYYKLIELGVVK